MDRLLEKLENIHARLYCIEAMQLLLRIMIEFGIDDWMWEGEWTERKRLRDNERFRDLEVLGRFGPHWLYSAAVQYDKRLGEGVCDNILVLPLSWPFWALLDDIYQSIHAISSSPKFAGGEWIVTCFLCVIIILSALVLMAPSWCLC